MSRRRLLGIREGSGLFIRGLKQSQGHRGKCGVSRTRRRCPGRDLGVRRGGAGAEKGDQGGWWEGSWRWAWLEGEGGEEGRRQEMSLLGGLRKGCLKRMEEKRGGVRRGRGRAQL